MSVSVLSPVVVVAFLLVALLFTLGLSALIVWLVWRAVKKPVNVPPVLTPDRLPANVPPVPPAVRKKSRWWLWLLLLLVPVAGVLLALGGISLLLFARPVGRPVPVAASDSPHVLEFEIRHAGTNLFAQLPMVAGQRAFTDIIRLPHASYAVSGAVWPERGGSCTLELTVRNHPDDSSSANFRQVVFVGVPFWVGRLREDEFRVTLDPRR